MPPPPEEVRRFDGVSIALHALLVTAIVIDLVFTEITAKRDDNDTVYATSPSPSHKLLKNPSGRPVRRLLVFGVTFVVYLGIKSYEIVLSVSWYLYKKVIDEISLLVGGFSLVALVLTTTIKFTKYVAFPVFMILAIGRYVCMCPPEGNLHEMLLEFFYIKELHMEKLFSYCWCTFKVFICYGKLRRARYACESLGRKLNIYSNQDEINDYRAMERVVLAKTQALKAAKEFREVRMTHYSEVIATARAAAIGGGAVNGAVNGAAAGGVNEDVNL